MDLSGFRYGSMWTKCIDQVQLDQFEERGRVMWDYLSRETVGTITILSCIYIFHSIHCNEQVSWTATFSIFLHQHRQPMIMILTFSNITFTYANFLGWYSMLCWSLQAIWRQKWMIISIVEPFLCWSGLAILCWTASRAYVPFVVARLNYSCSMTI